MRSSKITSQAALKKQKKLQMGVDVYNDVDLGKKG